MCIPVSDLDAGAEVGSTGNGNSIRYHISIVFFPSQKISLPVNCMLLLLYLRGFPKIVPCVGSFRLCNIPRENGCCG